MRSKYPLDPNDLKRLRSTDHAERQASSRRIATLLQSADRRMAKAVLEGLFSEVMPIIAGKLDFLKAERERDNKSILERLGELVQRTLTQVWLGRMSYDPGHCDLGAWMLCHARIVWGKMRAEEADWGKMRAEEAERSRIEEV